MSTPQVVYRSAGTGPAFWGPGDRYTFLVTGEQTGGAYFVMEAVVPPGLTITHIFWFPGLVSVYYGYLKWADCGI
jgi:hypothetical protein